MHISDYLALQYTCLMEEIVGMVDGSFKYILLGFNFLTLIVVYLHKRNRKPKREHHLLFVTAHPDDEVMFFGPTISALSSEYFIHLLCLSGGGTPREEELKLSAQNLALHRHQCISHPKLEDSMKEKWCEETIRSIVSKYILEYGIRAVFTFDSFGVSGHLNHKAIHLALSQWETQQEVTPLQPQPIIKQDKNQTAEQEKAELKEKEQERAETEKERVLKIYYLQSCNILRKYTGCLQILVALVREFSWVRINYISAWQAMKFHASQFTWFRKLWVLFSRYTYVNTFQLRRVLVQ